MVVDWQRQWQITTETGVFQRTNAYTNSITGPRIEKLSADLDARCVARRNFSKWDLHDVIFGAHRSGARSRSLYLFLFSPSFAQCALSLRRLFIAEVFNSDSFALIIQIAVLYASLGGPWMMFPFGGVVKWACKQGRNALARSLYFSYGGTLQMTMTLHMKRLTWRRISLARSHLTKCSFGSFSFR